MPGGTTDADLAGLRELKSLRALDLVGTPLTDAGLARIAELRSLRSLDLNGTGVTDAGLRHREVLAGLRSLALHGCANVTDEGIRRLRKALPGWDIRR